MKFIYFGYDFAFDTLATLLHDGHELAAIFTFPCDEIFSSNARLRTFADENAIPIFTDTPTKDAITNCAGTDTELILSTGYLYKIPDCSDHIPYAINIHPALLPKARGMMPLPYIIQSEPKAAGLTAHKITDDYDAGDIIAQHPVTIGKTDTLEQLAARLGMAMPAFALDIVNHLPERWANATPQDHNQVTHCPAPNDALRVIDWSQTVEGITRHARAYGRMGLLFQLDGNYWVTNCLSGRTESHDLPTGTVRYLSARDIVIACGDGYICISEAERIPSQ